MDLLRITRVRLTSPSLAAIALTGALTLAGCGSGASSGPTATTATTPAPPPTATAPSVPPGPPSATRIIRRWADTLRASDVAGAAALFGLPALVQGNPGLPAVRLTRRRQLLAFNGALPCGAMLIRTERRGVYVEGVFRLVDRPGVACDGPGAIARAAFRIRDGRIVEWRRRLDDPRDSRPPRPAAPDSGATV